MKWTLSNRKVLYLIIGVIFTTLLLQQYKIPRTESHNDYIYHTVKVIKVSELGKIQQNMSYYDPEKAWEIRHKRLKQQCHLLHQDTSNKLQPKNAGTWFPDPNMYIIEKLHFIAQLNPKTHRDQWQIALWNNSLPFGSDLWRNEEIRSGIWQDYKLEVYGIRKVHQYRFVKLKCFFDSYFAMFTVRHPFDRLESVFVDKISKENYFQRLHGREILKLFRDKSLLEDSGVDTFALRTGKGVTFEEFLRYVIEKPSGDEHWKPYSLSSHPCNINYSYIAKSETIKEDMNYIINTQLQGRGGNPQNTPTSKDIPPDPSNTAIHGVVLELFSELSDPKFYINKLMGIYGDDMKLFGYDVRLVGDNKVMAFCDSYTSDGKCL